LGVVEKRRSLAGRLVIRAGGGRDILIRCRWWPPPRPLRRPCQWRRSLRCPLPRPSLRHRRPWLRLLLPRQTRAAGRPLPTRSSGP